VKRVERFKFCKSLATFATYVCICVCQTYSLFGQITIYTETFTNQEFQGATGVNGGGPPNIDLSSVDWTIDVSSGNFDQGQDHFYVINEMLEARDVDGNVYWFSPLIDISTCFDVSVQLDAMEVGNMEASDVLISEYRIDGGAWTVFDLNGSLSDDFTSKMVQQTSLVGLALELRIMMKNTANSEKHQIDNIRIAGTPYQPPSAPTITSITEGDSHLVVYFIQGSDGGSAVTDIEYSIDGGITWISTGSVSSPISIIGLTNGISYDVRVRAINAIGDGDPSLGMIGTPIASSTKPVLDFQNASFLSTNTATLGATILSDGGESISSRGTLWSTSPQPNTNQLAEGGTAVGDFQHLRTGFTKNSLYYFRAYAVNSIGTGYSSDGTFTTLQDPPIAGNGSDASTFTITANWTAPSGGGSETFTYEIQLSTLTDFSSIASSQSGISSGMLSYIFTGLNENTTYYYRIRSVNAGGNSTWSNTSTAYSTLGNSISLNGIGVTETEDFNTLVSSGTSSVLPTGWHLYETDNNADNTYTAGSGTSNSGDSYSYGSGSERALGGLCTNSLAPCFGAKVTNNVGGAVTNIAVTYSGETWRVASNNRSDQLDFQYSLNANSLSDGTANWVDFDGLDYTNPGQSTGNGSVQHSMTIADTIYGIDLLSGGVIWIRWVDLNVSGSDDGMAIDDFNITAICPSITSEQNITDNTTCGVDNITVSTDAMDGTGSWSNTGIGLFSQAADANTDFTTNSYDQNQTLTWTNSYGACSGNTVTITAKFNQPESSSINSSLVASTSWLWGGLTSTDGNDPSNWYLWDGNSWNIQSVNLPGTSDNIHVLSNSIAGTCVSASSSLLSNQDITDLIVGSGAVVDLSGTITVAGDLTNDGTISSGTSTVLFNGTSDQTISGSAITLNNVTCDKASGDLEINSSVALSGTFTMTSGNIVNSLPLIIGTSSTNTGAISYSSGIVTGPLQRYFSNSTGSKFFPVGNATIIRDVTIDFTSAPGVDQYLTVSYVSGLPQDPNGDDLINGLPLTTNDGQLVQNYEDEGYWQIDPTNDDYSSPINTKAYNITLHMNNLSVVNDYTLVRIIKSPGSNTSSQNHLSWSSPTHISCIGSNTDFLATASSSGFSFFGAGGDDNNPLPVELIMFSGDCSDGIANLTWQTASEYNSSHFNLEHSRDGLVWDIVNTQAAAGNSTELLTYQFEDPAAFMGDNYYRLTQVDIDGTENIYDIINVNCSNTQSDYFMIYPNPSSGSFNVILNNPQLSGSAEIRITDSKGNRVINKPIEVKNGINMYILNENISNGLYYINISNGEQSTNVLKHTVQ